MQRLGLITSNISADFLTPPGVPAWEERQQPYAQVLRAAAPDVIGLQEVTPPQLEFLRAQLPEFAALTVPIVDPDPALLAAWQARYARFGFASLPDPYEIVLFYRTEALEPLAAGHWWLSPTPDRPSIGFGNTAPRVVLWAHLRPRASGREFFIFNTHLDHRCLHPMVELCRERFAAFAARGLPRLFIGDLNLNPASPDFAQFINDGWRDSHAAASDQASTTFLYELPVGGRIDHILYAGEGLAPQAWARLLSPDPERRVSDHDPVYAQFLLE